jgi:lipopolysaccharide transport system permease protein
MGVKTTMSDGIYIVKGKATQLEQMTYFINLLYALVIREFKGRYRRSLLGPLWAIIQPILYLIIFVFMRGIFSISSEGMPYILFAYCALVPWTFFSTALNRCGYAIYNNAPVIKKTPAPREVYLLANVITSIIEFFVSAIILLAMMIWFRVSVGWSLLWVPVLLLLTVLMTLSFGMGLSAVGTYKLDILFGIPFIMQFWMLATPVMYPLSQVPQRWQSLYSLNPMVGIIEGFRAAIVKGVTPDLGLLGISLAVTMLVWIVAWPMFRHLSQYFADVL